MKLIPASRARPTIRDDVASSVGPPNIMVPRHIGEIFRPLRPSWRYCIGQILRVCPVIPGRIEDANPESRDSPMCNCTSEVWSCGPSRNDGDYVSFFNILN